MIKKIQVKHLQGAPGVGRQLTSNEKNRFLEVYDESFDELELKQSGIQHMFLVDVLRPKFGDRRST